VPALLRVVDAAFAALARLRAARAVHHGALFAAASSLRDAASPPRYQRA
jgi:hypothetical protein